MWTYEQARAYAIEHLRREADAQVKGRYQEIGAGYDDLDANLPRNGEPEFNKLHIALRFWDEWIYARDHLWQSPIVRSEREWPGFAYQIADCLELNDEIADPRLLEKFGPDTR